MRSTPTWIFLRLNEAALDRERELELVLGAQAGDQAAMDLLWRHVRPFAASMALPYARRGNLDLEDLIGEMALGFMAAVPRFDPTSGNRLVTYAKLWFLERVARYAKRYMRGSIDMTLTERERDVYRDIRATGITDSEQLQARHGVVARTVDNALVANVAREVRIDARLAGREGWQTADWLRSEEPDAADQLERAETEQLRLNALRQALASLPSRSRTILLRRAADQPSTFTALAPVFGIKRQAVQQIERQALWTLTQTVCELLGVPVPRNAKRPLTRRLFCTYCAKIGLAPEGHARIGCPKRVGPGGRPRSRRRRKAAPACAAA